MKTALKSPSILVLKIATVLVAIGVSPLARAGLTGPYTNDFYTLHLWHMQDISGTVQYVATNGVYEYDYATNPLVAQLVVSNTPGPILIGGPTPPTNFLADAGQSGPGTGPLFQAIGTDFGYTLSIQTTQYSAFFAPWDNVGGAVYPDLSYAETNNSCSFVNTNTGAFTWEALIQPNFNPLTYTADKNPEILCTDGGNSTGPGANPYTERAVQFRFDNATPSSGQAELEFNGNISSLSVESHDFFGMLPTTGPDAVAQGTWYHIAAAFTGTAPTNGDPPNVFTLYWTKFDPTRTNADILTNVLNAFTFTNTSLHTVYSLAYPSNSIIGGGPFVIGNSARGVNGGWIGNIAEVRISDYYRHSNEFMFNSSVVPSKPLVTGPTTNNLVGYGHTLNLNLAVAGSQPYAYQWYQNGAAITGQTNGTLIVSNITYAANTETFYAIVTNAYGSATSAVASVTVGATFEGFFNTGCGVNDNPLDQTAPGSVDLHWTFPPGGNPDNNSPNAIVWSDAGPLNSGGGIVPGNGASVWIGPSANIPSAGVTAGTYTFQTTFQVDESVVTTNTVITGTFGACGATGGSAMTMSLNGVQTLFTMSGNPQESIYSFTLTNGLQPGSNTLQFTANQSGGDYCALNVGILSDTTAALTNAPVITNEPAGVTNEYGSTVSFSAVALAAPPLSYYWLSNGVAVTPPVWVGTTLPYLSFVATNFSASQLVGTNYFANVQIVFSNYVGVVTSAVATLNIQLPPLTLVSAGVPIWNSSTNETNIVVYFSGAVDPGTAIVAGNYSLDNGASILSAALGGASNEVVLTTSSPLSPTTSYTLTVQNVNSSFGFIMNPSPQSLPVGTYPTVDFWFKAAAGVITDSTGTNVTEWNDQTVNANDLIAPFNPPFDPLLATNASGYPVVTFDATNETILEANDSVSIAQTNDITIFAVMNFGTLAGGTNGDIVSKATSNLPSPYDYYVNSSSVVLLRGNGRSAQQVASTKVPSLGTTHLLDVVMKGWNVTHRLDGQPNGSGTMTPINIVDDPSETLTLGTRDDGHNRLTGGINELILIGSALSPSDVASMENLLNAEYSLQPPISTNPTNITFSLANNQLTLSWPTDHTGWQLQAQTNSLAVGINTNWVNVANSTTTNQVVVPINLTNGSVFYRLTYQP